MSFFHQVPGDDVVKHCKKILEEGSIGNRGDFDGDYFQQLFGLVAQTMTCNLLGLPWPQNEGFDGGFDFYYAGGQWDVKVVIRSSKPLVRWACNVPAVQTKFFVDGYLFMNYDKSQGLYSYCGWITKKEFLEKAVFRAKGSTVKRDDGSTQVAPLDFYEIPIKELHRIKSREDLLGLGGKK